MALSIRSGPADVLHCGTVTTFGGQPLELCWADEASRHTVILSFRSDPSVADVAVESTQEEGTLRLELVNFDGPDGRGSALPVLLGARGDDLLFLHFRVFRFGRTDDRTVHFTFFRTTQEAVGWTPR